MAFDGSWVNSSHLRGRILLSVAISPGELFEDLISRLAPIDLMPAQSQLLASRDDELS